MSVLVINLTRFGDLIQTQPVISAFKAEGHETGLACLENFASSAGLLADLDQIHPLPGAAILADLEKDWIGAAMGVGDWVKKVLAIQKPDLLVNLTPTVSARMLSSCFGIANRRGFLVDEHGFGIYSTPWAAFLQAASQHRGCSPFNVMDLFFRAAHLKTGFSFSLQTPSDWDRKTIKALIEKQIRAKTELVPAYKVGFQLGASEERRRWPLENYIRLGDLLWEKCRAVPVLLGSKTEKEFSSRYTRQCGHPCVDMVGQTSLKELGASLVDLDLLVTNDTGTMHLAAGLSVPILSFFLATAQPWDTGPYLNDSICIQPDLDCHPCQFGRKCDRNMACRYAINPESVFEMTAGFLDTRKWTLSSEVGFSAWQTVIREGQTHSMKALGKGRADSWWMWVQRHFYGQLLDGKDFCLPKIDLPPDLNRCEIALPVLEQCSALCTLFVRQIQVLKAAPGSKMGDKVLLTWEKVGDCLRRESMFKALATLLDFQGQEASADLDGLGQQVTRYAAMFECWAGYLKGEMAQKLKCGS